MSENCTICPRHCATDRIREYGHCKTSLDPVVHSALIHHGEESMISGYRGSGTVFFSGCNLTCVFCQNHDISQRNDGTVLTAPELAEVFLKLEKRGVHNINLVTPGHFVPPIADAIGLAKEKGIKIPFVYNTNGYDAMSSLEALEGLIDIYMPDLKFADDSLGLRYVGVADYFTVAQQALIEMDRQVGEPVIRHGVMERGVLIRHLVMPGLHEDSIKVLDWIKENLPNAIINLMDQYRPAYKAKEYKEINRRLKNSEYRLVVEHLLELGLETV